MRKNIKELTEDEARELLKFVYRDDDHWFESISHEPTINDNGEQQISFDGRSIIGVKFRNDHGDGCILHFDNTKALLWLYKEGYEILDLLESSSYLSEMENDFDNFSFAISWMAKGEDGFREGFKQNWTLEYVTKKCEKLLEKYYYKDYK